MKFTLSLKARNMVDCDLLVLRLFEETKQLTPEIRFLDKVLQSQITARLKMGDFKGEAGETLLLFPGAEIQAKRFLLLGLGKKKEYSLEKMRMAIGALAPIIKKYRIKKLAIALIQTRPPKTTVETVMAALTESLLLATYEFKEYKKTEPQDRETTLQEIQYVLNQASDKIAVQKGARQGEIIATAVNFARNLGNHPSNIATPEHLAAHALELAHANPQKIKTKIFGRKEMVKEKMGALLAVSQGSEEEPKFIILEYQGASKTKPWIALVGKGITFDSGGISIKPSEKMEEMKFDMAGAATVMGIIKAASELKLPVNLVGLIPATENLPSGKAIKPGDIVRARSGKTIEIVNTDAEGRLVLADALDYAKKYQPDLVIDFATLTGAIVVALGDDLIGAFTNQESFLPNLKVAAERTGEKIWPMPLEQSYEEFLKSDFADLRNISTQVKIGDAIHAANFLRQFVNYPWIHLDIAGVAWSTREKPYRPKGATGAGVRLAIEFLQRFKK